MRRITQEVEIPVTCKIRKVDKNSLQSTLNFCYELEVSYGLNPTKLYFSKADAKC